MQNLKISVRYGLSYFPQLEYRHIRSSGIMLIISIVSVFCKKYWYKSS